MEGGIGMLNIVIGRNASGKTFYLERLIKKYGITNVNTNLANRDDTYDIPYNKQRIEILKNVMDADEIHEQRSVLSISGDLIDDISPEFLELVSLICRDKDILLLDEPFKLIRDNEYGWLLDFLAQVQLTYSKIVIVTHNELALGLPDICIMTIKMEDTDSNISQIPVTEDMAYAVID